MTPSNLDLYYLLLGCTPPGRHTEQHDVFFAIGSSLSDIADDIKAFWPDAGKIHIDCWRRVSAVEGHRISVIPRAEARPGQTQLFFINLGGYQPFSFEEHHYKLLTIAPDMGLAIQAAKQTAFYRDYNTENKKGLSHVDNKYGVDVDEVLNVADILPAYQKASYALRIEAAAGMPEDPLEIGYLKLSDL